MTAERYAEPSVGDQYNPASGRGLRSFRLIALALLGTLLVQASWAFVVPPFRGLDEHDHAYKAAAVARGDWSPQHEASDLGWGSFLEVPGDIVAAAAPVCRQFSYTTRHNCEPVVHKSGEIVVVASSAARYNPVYYAVVGSATYVFEGVPALLAMRALSALMCASLLALAILAAHRTSRGPWPGAALILAATPTMLYTMSVTAPNGVEVASAALVWTALLGLRRSNDHSTDRGLLIMATIGAIPLAMVRGLGPLWLLMIVGSIVALLGAARLRSLARNRTAPVCVLITCLATIAGAGWTMTAKSVAAKGDHGFTDSLWIVVPKQWVLWFFQSVAAFPARDEIAPMLLYIVVFLVWWGFLAIAWRAARMRERVVLTSIVVAASAIPVAATIAVFERMGTAWQGRYAYPFALGFLLVCGAVLDRRGQGRWLHSRWPVWVAATTMTIASIIGQLDVLARELNDSPLAGTGAWWAPHPGLVVALNVVGFGMLAAALTLGRRGSAATLPA